MNGDKKSLGKLILVFIMAVVGLVFTPSLQTEVTGMTWTNNGTAGFPPTGNNLTGASRTVIALFPLFWVIGLIAIPIYYARKWLNPGA